MSSKFALVLLFGCVAFKMQASVRTIQFNPPLSIAAGEVEGNDLGMGTSGIDFNLDGRMDVKLVHGAGGITMFFDSPARVAVKGSVAAVPFGTVIASNLPLQLGAQWNVGTLVSTNSELRQFGERQKMVLTTLTAPQLPGSPVQVAGGGTPITQPVFASGDVVGKEGVMAVEFYINGQPHYGYIQFEFRNALGTGGYIRGLAYETEPSTPITAARIGNQP
jgi:hypothetical protein